MNLRIPFSLGLVLALVLAGCNTVPVAEQIDQKQALEIVALLNSHGISAAASKERQGYTVTVRKGLYAEAIGLMKESKLPGELKMSFRELVGEQGFIPSSRDVEAMRLDHALAVEIEDLLENNPEIVSARAVVRLNFRRDSFPPGVAVVLRVRPGSKINAEEIAKLVLGIVPGVSAEKVLVTAKSDEPESPGHTTTGRLNQGGPVVSVPLAAFLFWRVAEGDLTGIALTFVGMLSLAILVGALVGYSFATYRHSKTLVQRESPEGVPLLSLKVEKGRKGLPGA